MGIAEATAAPRIHHQWLPDRIFFEPGISKDTLNILETMGHNLSQRQRIMGSTQSIQNGPGVSIFGASDPRRDGAAAVPQRE
jgi:gamma-glutamyltranspeptidase/glutathione hydrolase